jgi:hypothetical protein
MKNATPLQIGRVRAWVMGLAGLAFGAGSAGAMQDASAPEDVALTIGADGVAAVREVRSAQLVAGDNRVRVYDVSPKILAETVALRSLAAPDMLALRDQSIWFEVLDPERALKEFLGRPAVLYRWHEAVQEKLEGHLLFPPVVPGPKGDVRIPLYLEQNDGKIRLIDSGEVELDSMPAGDWNRTRVDWRVACKRPDRYRIELDYLTAGLSWHADASLRLAPNGETGDVAFVASIRNDTGIAWKGARVGFTMGEGPVGEARRPDAERASAAYFAFDDPITLEARRSAQVVLASAHDLPVTSAATLVVPRESLSASVPVFKRYDVVNAAGAGLGRALPAATGRALVVDAKNRPVPFGARELPASAVGEVISFPGPVEPGLVAHVMVRDGGGDKGKRSCAADLWSERTVNATVELLIPLEPAEKVVDSNFPADLLRPDLARVTVPVLAHAQATATFNVARP